MDFRCRVELRPLGVARGIKGKGPRLTFEPLRLLSEFRRKQKMSELNKYTTRTLETHIYTIADQGRSQDLKKDGAIFLN